MKKVLIVLSFIFVSSTATAVCLKGHPSLSEEYANSQSVLIGKVITEEAVRESVNYYDGHDYVVEVREIFKGDPSSVVVIFSENSTGRYPMSVGSTYILFVYYELGRYQINNCGNSGLLSEKLDIVQAVRNLKRNENETNK